MARTVDAAIVTAAALYQQEVCYAVEIGYATPKRVTDNTRPVVISGDTYAVGDITISSLVCSGEPANTATISVGNEGSSATEFGQLDLSEDSCGKTAKIYEVWQTAGGEESHLVFDGVVSSFSGGSTRCSISCRRDMGVSTRPGNYLVWPDEFPHTPKPGTVFEIGGQSSTAGTAPRVLIMR